MATCSKCNQEIPEGTQFCAACGSPANGGAAEAQAAAPTATVATASAPVDEKKDAEDNKLMGIVSYLIFFVPLLTGDHKKSEFVRFHVNQGTVLALTSIIGSIALAILGTILAFIPIIGWLIGLVIAIVFPIGIFVLWLMGILAALKGEKKELPIIGKYTIIK